MVITLHTPDYPKAIEIYQIASGLQKAEGSENFCHPLALFSLAYIYFNYHRRGYLKDVPNIDILEPMTPEERLEKSILYCNLSIAFYPNGLSYNNLRNISNSLSPEGTLFLLPKSHRT